MNYESLRRSGLVTAALLAGSLDGFADPPEIVSVEGQPLAANVTRLIESLQFLGSPPDEPTVSALMSAVRSRDARLLQQVLDPHVLFVVSIHSDSRLQVTRGLADAVVQQAGFTPTLVKVLNRTGMT